jgi:hypothetical protein
MMWRAEIIRKVLGQLLGGAKNLLQCRRETVSTTDVLIDASNYARTNAATATSEKGLGWEPMRRELLEKLPALKKADLAVGEWDGNPGDHKALYEEHGEISSCQRIYRWRQHH